MKVVCVHPRLSGFTSHHFNEAQSFIAEFARRGDDFELLVSVHAPPAIADALGAHAVVDDPTFEMRWSYAERTERFVAMLHEQLDDRTAAGDCVLLTVATQLEAHGLARWVAQRPPRRAPWVVVLFLSDRWNRGDRAEHDRQAAEFAVLRATLAGLAPRAAQRLIFLAVTTPLAGELSELLGAPVDPAPMPLAYDGPPPPPRPVPARPRAGVLGGLRGEKGSYLIPGIVRACAGRIDVDFVVQLANNTLTDDELAPLAAIAGEPHVTVICGAIAPEEYYRELIAADLGVFPYELIPYRQRASGVFGEMVGCGKPVVTTGETWLAQQIESGRAVGVVCDDRTPEAIADAIAGCVADLEPLTRSARDLIAAWREYVSVPAFVDVMKAAIATRSGERRRWWRP